MSVKCTDCYPNYLAELIRIAEEYLAFLKREPPPTQEEIDAKLIEREAAEKRAWDDYENCLTTCIP